MDARKLSHQTLEELRKLVVERIEEGVRAVDISRVLGLSLPNIYSWVRLAREGGPKALDAKPIPGRPSKLSEEHRRTLLHWVRTKTPYDFGFDTFLWTSEVIQSVLKSELGISLHPSNVSRQLHAMGLTPQKPLQRAYERNARAVKKWKEEEYPALKARVRKESAVLYFLDEMGIRTTDSLGRTWGEKGKRPVVEKTGQNFGVNVISALSPQGAFRFMVLEENFNASAFGLFLDRLMKKESGKIYLVLDNHPVHWASSIAKQVKGYGGRLEFVFLPGYAPDINPEEGVWSLAKPRVKKKDVDSKEELKEATREVFRSLAKLPSYLSRIFQSPQFQYAASKA